MRLCSVELINFRNYGHLRLSFPGGTHIFHGSNAQGKTNLLEAIYLCTCARSHRTGRDDELVRQGEDFYRASVGFVTDRGLSESVSIEYRRPPEKNGAPSRIILYNEMEIGRLADMMGLFHAILFAPEDLQIVKGGPAERRRFLDILISRTDRTYFLDLQAYWRILAHRNRLLKSLRAREQTEDAPAGKASGLPVDSGTQLDVWDETLAGHAAAILEKRIRCVSLLSQYASLSLQHLTGSKESLELHYKGLAGLVTGMDRRAIASLYLERLIRAREDDLSRGSTSQGPHRDDMLILLNGSDARVYASQGQQRSAVLALKIAELTILTEMTGEKPILLLDDVMSELDDARRSRLMEVIRDHQVFITCTDPDPTGSGSDPDVWSGPVHFYRVKEGKVEPAKRPETA
ncbi:MAG TPA: DNA replication/repair protein RecF [Bacillota bacterium]|jgi:DNA replication and repair protein RecF|nr:DNA replication/repair protein RecF [Fastidiosipila sp.]HPX92626.1 DNA replication/repair protein RecF [Bacillota bacterium]HQB80993.1 DNA replication/repair protein RecF [Bacillota bacterium]